MIQRRKRSGRSGTANAWIRLAFVAGVCLAMGALASCERKPSKSDYVSARVRALCADEETTEALQACRLAVIQQLQDVPFEELKERYPPPAPRSRPSCSL